MQPALRPALMLNWKAAQADKRLLLQCEGSIQMIVTSQCFCGWLALVAWHNRLPSHLSLRRELSFYPPFILFKSMLRSNNHMCAWEKSRHLYYSELNMVCLWKGLVKFSTSSVIATAPWPFGSIVSLLSQQPLPLRPLKLAPACWWKANHYMDCYRSEV